MPETKVKGNGESYPIPLSPIMDKLNLSLDLRIEESSPFAMLLVKRNGETMEALLLNSHGASELRGRLTAFLHGER